MENAVDAIKMAFAIFVFTMALSLSIFMFNKAKATSDEVLASSDVTRFMEYIESSQMIGDERIVGLETIIPTLYKYYKENYTVIFLNPDGTPMEIYSTKTNVDLWSEGYTNKYYTNNTFFKIYDFNNNYIELIKFSNMIPVPKNMIRKIDYKSSSKLYQEYYFIIKYKKQILNKAKKTYINYEKNKYICVNFKNIERVLNKN